MMKPFRKVDVSRPPKDNGRHRTLYLVAWQIAVQRKRD